MSAQLLFESPDMDRRDAPCNALRLIALHDPREGKHVDGLDAAAKQRPRGRVRGRASREHVIDEKHALAFDARLCTRGHAKSALKVFAPLRFRQPNLWLRTLHPHQSRRIAPDAA